MLHRANSVNFHFLVLVGLSIWTEIQLQFSMQADCMELWTAVQATRKKVELIEAASQPEGYAEGNITIRILNPFNIQYECCVHTLASPARSSRAASEEIRSDFHCTCSRCVTKWIARTRRPGAESAPGKEG